MRRRESPQAFTALIGPPLPIGTNVRRPNQITQYWADDHQRMFGYSKDAVLFCWRTIVRDLVRKWREVGKGKLSVGGKKLVRDALEVVRKSQTIEIAGWAPRGMHCMGSVANQCYLQNGQSHGGVTWYPYLLFRYFDGKNHCVYIHSEPVRIEGRSLRADYHPYTWHCISQFGGGVNGRTSD